MRDFQLAPAAKSGTLRLRLDVAFVVAALDQLTKWSMLAAFRPAGVAETPFLASGQIEVLPILDLVLTWNRGVSFGLGNNDGAYNALSVHAACRRDRAVS